MRYANDPFWVRLRWIFFVLFWGLWVAMLVGAILIIVGAPKCSAPQALVWYKQGPLVKLANSAAAPPTADEVRQLRALGARGAIFEVPADETYKIGTAQGTAIEQRIRKTIDELLLQHIQPIVDVTPNFVLADDELFQRAKTDVTLQEAFVFAQSPTVPNNWVSKVNGSAWELVGNQQYVLSQFGVQRYDLQLNSTLAKDKFKAVLATLVRLGVRGVRLHNAKHFIVDRSLRNESPVSQPTVGHDHYDFYTHTYTTYQAGLGELLQEFGAVVRAGSNGEGFVTLAEQIERPDRFQADGRLAVELPIAGAMMRTLAARGGASPTSAAAAKQLFNEMQRIGHEFGNHSWMQWEYDESVGGGDVPVGGLVGTSEYNAFVMLLPGVPVAEARQLDVQPIGGQSGANRTTTGESTFLAELLALREQPSYMHGSFNVYTDSNDTVVAYTRYV